MLSFRLYLLSPVVLWSEQKALNHLTKKERFITSNAKVATVSSAGVIKAVRKGTCTVYVMSENGVCAKIKVTVK